jgi:hypothetical protein
MKQCTYCGKEQPDEATACPTDGEPLVPLIIPLPSGSAKNGVDDHSEASPLKPTAVASASEESEGGAFRLSGLAATSGLKRCPICNHAASQVVSGSLFYFKERECQRCGCQWTPAYSRLSIGVFVALCLASASIVMFIDDNVYIHGNMNAVSDDDKPIALAGVFFSMAAGCWGLLNGLLMFHTPKVQILRPAVRPHSASKPTPQAEGKIAQSNVKTKEGEGSQ